MKQSKPKLNNMQKRILAQADLDNNPELAENGLKVGDEIEIPDNEESNNVDGSGGAQNNLSDDDTGGSNPHPDKERP